MDESGDNGQIGRDGRQERDHVGHLVGGLRRDRDVQRQAAVAPHPGGHHHVQDTHHGRDEEAPLPEHAHLGRGRGLFGPLPGV